MHVESNISAEVGYATQTFCPAALDRLPCDRVDGHRIGGSVAADFGLADAAHGTGVCRRHAEARAPRRRPATATTAADTRVAATRRSCAAHRSGAGYGAA